MAPKQLNKRDLTNGIFTTFFLKLLNNNLTQKLQKLLKKEDAKILSNELFKV